MLTESNVISSVCDFLRAHGYSVSQQLLETEQGDDIVASLPSDGGEVVIEAKGETSSKSHTARFGKPFSLGQVRDHVANAFFRASQSVGSGRSSGIALPKNQAHVRYVEKIQPALRQLCIEVFWVLPDRKVEVLQHWPHWADKTPSADQPLRTVQNPQNKVNDS